MAIRNSQRLPSTLTFRIDPKIRKQLRKLAELRHMSEGSLVALFVEEGLKRQGVDRIDVLEEGLKLVSMRLFLVENHLGLPDQPPTENVPATDADSGNGHEPELAE